MDIKLSRRVGYVEGSVRDPARGPEGTARGWAARVLGPVPDCLRKVPRGLFA